MKRAWALAAAMIRRGLALFLLWSVGAPALAFAAPERVVSMNLCTDQLALLIAGEGQLISVSHLAREQRSSVLAEQAARVPVNHGRAEEVFLMRPDLVIAGTFTTRATVEMLRRLGMRVEEFAPANSFDDIRANIRRMGALLGREARAETLVANFNDGLADVEAAAGGSDPLAALYYTNSYTSGVGTLADEIVTASGLQNLSERYELQGTVKLPLELLVMGAPDLVIGREAFSQAPALARENYQHPALRAFGAIAEMQSKYWICGAPFTLQAATNLLALRERHLANETLGQ